MKENWMITRKGGDFSGLGEKFHISPRLACLIRNREIIGEEAIERYLNGTINDLYDGILMQDMQKAIEILMEKIDQKEKIRVIGDYDIDGVNATYILLEGLERLGADVDYDIPDRMKDGYGLNIQLVERAIEDGVDTIITCDNGIAAREEIAYAKSCGLTVLITDHHEVPYDLDESVQPSEKIYCLPPADAVVDPKRMDCTYPFKGLCGAAIAYKVVECLYQVMDQEVSDVDFLIENVAIATVGDVMELVDENRIFVKEGLEMLKRTSNLGLKALIAVTGISSDAITPYHIGFVLGPCINAGGRLSTAKRALELLRASTKKDADLLAGDLKALNESRKEMTEKAVEDAILQIEECQYLENPVLVLYLPECHESLAGIVAGRIREKYYRPCFVLTDGTECVKGSGRSIDAYSMYEELSKCKELFLKYGGHKTAAGVSLLQENVEIFREQVNVNATLTEEDLQKKILIDMQMPLLNLNEEFIGELERMEPFGVGNRKPVFVEKNLRILGGKVLGKNQNVLKFQVQDLSGIQMDAVYFGNVEECLELFYLSCGKERTNRMLAGNDENILIMATYYPSINEFRGERNLQIVMQNIRMMQNG